MSFKLKCKLSFDLLTSICLATLQTSDTLFLTPVAMDQPHSPIDIEKQNKANPPQQLPTHPKKGSFDEHAVCFANKTTAQPTSIQDFVLTSFTIKSQI